MAAPAAPSYYFIFIGLAMAVAFLIAIAAVVILCCSAAKHMMAARRMKREGWRRRAPSRRYERKEGEGEGEDECSVCLSAFADGQSVRQLPCCGGSFHVACVDKWMASHSSCPICRADVLGRVSGTR